MIYSVQNKTFPSNTYLIVDEHQKECVIIDAGLDEDLIDKKIQELQIQPIAIIATHGHFDHIGSVAFFKEKYNIPFYLHEADLKLSKSANFYLKLAKISKKIKTIEPDFILKGETENISIQNFDFNVYNFPGHSPGSCIIQYKDNLFSGDIIYKTGLGFNSFPGENKQNLKESIIEIFDSFPKDSLILPGHGKSEYLGVIQKDNLELFNFLLENKEINA